MHHPQADAYMHIKSDNDARTKTRESTNGESLQDCNEQQKYINILDKNSPPYPHNIWSIEIYAEIRTFCIAFRAPSVQSM